MNTTTSRGLALVCLTVLGLAGAQFSVTRFDFLGKSAPSITLHGSEFARSDTLASQLKIARSGDFVRVEAFERVMVLPVDADQARAAREQNTVQIDVERVQARTATLVNGNLYLPLATLALGLDADYRPGSFRLPAARLTGVSSRAGKETDRIVLDLNRDVRYQIRLVGSELQVVLPGTAGDERIYSTRGQFLPRVRVARQGNDLVLSAPLSPGHGHRVYRSAPGGTRRLIVDVGPGIESATPRLSSRTQKPLIVLDPVQQPAGDRLGDVPLELAREAAALLTRAGWQVRLTRTGKGQTSLAERASLARQSDVFLSLDVARFPAPSARGLTLYEGSGASSAAVIRNVRSSGQPDPLASLVVGGSGDNRRLAQLLQGEIKALNLPSKSAQLGRVYLLREAPHAAMLLELGWAGSDADVSRLTSDVRRRQLATALARSVASYLAARAGGKS